MDDSLAPKIGSSERIESSIEQIRWLVANKPGNQTVPDDSKVLTPYHLGEVANNLMNKMGMHGVFNKGDEAGDNRRINLRQQSRLSLLVLSAVRSPIKNMERLLVEKLPKRLFDQA